MNLDALKNPKIYGTLFVWLLSAILLLQTGQIVPFVIQLALITLPLSWFFLNRFIIEEVKVSFEIILFSFIITHFLDLQLIGFCKEEILSREVSGFFAVLHQLLMAIQVLLFGLVIIVNNKNKQRIIFIYVLLGLLSHFVIYQEQSLIKYAFYFLLFFTLLKSTTWIDSLHKKTLGLYFLFFLALFFLLLSRNPYTNHGWLELSSDLSWFTLPNYLFDLLKVYAIAIIVKIPAVIIYNHMTLSRKLWFAGIFQSIIPQIFQLTLSLILFFFFISGWQAQHLQEDLQNLKQLKPQNSSQLKISDGLAKKMKSSGIIKKTFPSESYFYFLKDTANSKIIYYQNIDSLLCKQLWTNSEFIFSNGLIAYPFKSASWEKYLDKIDLWQRGHADKIAPFSFVASFENWFTGYYEDANNRHSINGILFQIPGKGLSVGRVTLPLYNLQGQQISRFAFDIMLNYKKLPFNDTMVGMVFAILLVFSLINFFIIRRVSDAGALINKTIITKFENLKFGIREIAGGNLKHKLKLVGEDEFVELARHFNQMGEKLEDTISEAREKDRLDQELSIARDVQLSLLKSILPDIKGFDVVATLETAQEVSGDFYDLTNFDEDKILFTVGDVSGKGASAAFYMAQFISLFRYSAQFTAFPKEIALRINEYFTKHVEDKHIFITAIIGVLDIKTRKISLIRAGHNYPYLINKKGEVQELKQTGIGIGLTNDSAVFKKSIEKYDLVLKKDEKLIIYTDGLIEATRIIDGVEHQYGEEKLKQKLSAYQEKNAAFILNDLISDIDSFFAGQPKNDDLTLLVIQKL